jgi:hypothetical protein
MSRKMLLMVAQSKEEFIDISSNYANILMKTPETKKKASKQRDGGNIFNTGSQAPHLSHQVESHNVKPRSICTFTKW